ncbi:hypothetical protein Patl1_31939 [Pistacia atlantica]|uniref:Uncharacterized protein n=1 Tax=Pistacia atlantica TaxID=434234 RepID=A0ACC1AQM3_9ROSI|nr:hypothetical protein Patl1_31939 [Pistacia atlantica]
MEKLSVEESQRLLHMEKALQRHIIGQPEAVEAISRAVRRVKVGMRDPSRPLASFLFAGSTGVGKIELAHALAAKYFGSEKSLIRIDMSEYMEKHTVSKFLGSPSGYYGCRDGGQCRSIRRFWIFDRLTDSKGKDVNFKRTFIIMTSNVGSDIIAKKSHLGGNDSAYGARPLKRAIRRLVEDSLAEKILGGAFKAEDYVKMDFDSNGNIIVKQRFILD